MTAPADQLEADVRAGVTRVIRALRETQTQRQLAEALGITQPALWNYEHGVRTPRVTVALRLCRVAGITLDAMLSEAVAP